MTAASEGGTAGPRQPVAPDTHPRELERLALQELAHADCRPLAVQVVIWLFRAYNAANSSHSRTLRPLKLSPSGFNVLMTLRNSPDQVVEPNELASRMLVSKPSVSGLLDTLERRKLVQRRRHPEDGRRVLVELTAAGAKLLDSHFAAHYASLNAIVADLDDDQQATLVQLLRRLDGAAPPDLLA